MNTPAQAWTITLIAALSFLWPDAAYAMRTPPPAVPPVVWQGVEYRVKHMGHVQAFDQSSRRKLWETKVYHVWINPLLEEDVQWVFISGMQVKDGILLVTNEDGKSYRLNLKTGHVEGFLRAWSPWLFAVFILAVVVLFLWIRILRGPLFHPLP